MRFRLHTLIDITETGARRHEDGDAYKQQQNWMTTLQTLGLRANPHIIKCEFGMKGAKKLGFGSEFKGTQRIWTVDFEIERENGLDIKMLQRDFDFVPVITNLNESAKFKKDIFQTSNLEYTNIVFEEFG
jgi:hypothetical protein